MAIRLQGQVRDWRRMMQGGDCGQSMEVVRGLELWGAGMIIACRWLGRIRFNPSYAGIAKRHTAGKMFTGDDQH
jgi:hypothetical protein